MKKGKPMLLLNKTSAKTAQVLIYDNLLSMNPWLK